MTVSSGQERDRNGRFAKTCSWSPRVKRTHAGLSRVGAAECEGWSRRPWEGRTRGSALVELKPRKGWARYHVDVSAGRRISYGLAEVVQLVGCAFIGPTCRGGELPLAGKAVPWLHRQRGHDRESRVSNRG
ncbi:glycosyl transferase family 2 [Mycolicibacterium novocastrense]|uniref:Glycosyl transferase family 2 n=1 Tax=Mycolicibacterium novocastrense TaxID=59813 RepID=A0ABQ0KQ50_MYCNV|nr:glycosyl transferase family 2 [Mycolicibacterium novocastrense]